MLLFSSFQKARITALFNGEASYRVMAIRETLSNSLLAGGNQTGKEIIGQWPDSGSDLFSYVSIYYGLAVAIIAIGIIVSLFVYMLQKSIRQTSQLGMLISSGCCVVFLVQIMIWLTGNLGLLPIDGYCPFLTYGGTGTITTFVLLGIILCIFRNKNVFPANVVIKKKIRKKEFL